MQQPKRAYLFAGLVSLLVLGGVAFAAVGQGSDVAVQQAYFVAAEPAGEQLNLTARLFVTNDAMGRSDGLSIAVFVVPTHSGLASYTTRVDVGTLAGRTTTEVTVPIVVPGFNASRSYRVDFLVFEGGLLTQKGSGSIGWGGGYWQSDLMAGGAAYATKEAMADGLSVQAPSFERVG